MKKVISISLTLILIVIFISGCIKQIPNEIDDRTCSSDDDCVIVAKLDPKNRCCNLCEVEIINKQAKINRDKLWLKNCKDVECPIYDCYMEKLPKAKCISNLCEIEWVERISTK